MSNELNLSENVEFSIKRRFGIITLNRPERGNALTVQMLKDILNILEQSQYNEKVRGLILQGNGNSFTTGLDIKGLDPSDTVMVKEIEDIAGNITSLLYYGKPVISAINGKAMGDGVIYTLASDYRIATKDSVFQMPEINYGIFPGTGCIVLMTRIIGISWTKKMLMFAEKITAEKAIEIGLIDEIVDTPDELLKKTMERAKFLFPKNQTVINAIKLCSNHLLDKSYMEAYELEKEGSGWYEHENKEEFISNFRRRFFE